MPYPIPPTGATALWMQVSEPPNQDLKIGTFSPMNE
jgi:hypothetical protein